MATDPTHEPSLFDPQTFCDLVNRLSSLHREGKLGGVTHDDLLLIVWACGGYTADLLKARAGK